MSTTDTGARGAARTRRPSSFLLHVDGELKEFWRSPITLAFIVAMPVMFYVGFGFAFRSEADEIRVLDTHEITQGNLSYGGILGFALMSVAFANVAIGLAIRRHHGLFKRFRTTPVTPLTVMGAYLVNTLMTTVIVLGVVTALGVLLMGVDLAPARVPQLLLALMLGFVCMAPLGAAVSLLPPNADAAVPMVNGIFFPAAFLAGGFIILPLGDTVSAVVDLLPGRPLTILIQSSLAETGPTWDWPSVWLLLAWALLGTVVALRWFRWASEREPRGFGSAKKKAAETAETAEGAEARG
ncbi:ABC transporter permease [Nocardiopsis sp. MG754419]|uniref:ABC transporter permease n=1 Tax=Nocardiopsis sp. MG754419 TaxID=2259865 RepID=UPI001BA77F51|nr:ABC transporter permease [Nocardiopsis sp. MG754419]MBR8743384.1 ABC transporter permease [Nocardiopsis sp. MG754419]